MKKNTSCCVFHDFGGPHQMACDNYGRVGREPKDASLVDPSTERAVLYGDLIEWDAHNSPGVELASDAFDATEAQVPDIVDFG